MTTIVYAYSDDVNVDDIPKEEGVQRFNWKDIIRRDIQGKKNSNDCGVIDANNLLSDTEGNEVLLDKDGKLAAIVLRPDVVFKG